MSSGHSQRAKGLLAFCSFVLVVGLLGQVATGSENRIVALFLFVTNLVTWSVITRSAWRKEIQAHWSILLFGITLVVVVAFPPATSHDVNSYALYGRVIAEHGESPYLVAPSDVPGDVWSSRVSYYWRDAPTVYGPLFTSMSAAVMAGAGESFHLARLGFQLIDVAALVAAVAIAARMLRDVPLAIALIGLNPLMLTFGVNDAHCDVLMGALLLAACPLLMRQRFVWAGIALAAAVLVKVTALVGLAGAAVWVLSHHGVRRASMFGVAAMSAIIGGMLCFGGVDVLRPLTDASARVSRFSLWNPIDGLVGDPSVVTLTANCFVATLGSYLIVRFRKQSSPYMAIACGLVVYQLIGAYVLSWYALWAIPVLALAWRSPLASICFFHGCAIAVAYLSGYGLMAATGLAVAWMATRRLRGREVFPWIERDLAPSVRA